MKLASFKAAGKDRIGLTIDESRIYDLTPVLQKLSVPPDMMQVILGGEPALKALRDARAAIAADPNAFESFKPGEIEWQPPVRNPSKICCLALNNSANADRIIKGPKHPAMFMKPASSLVGHNNPIECYPEYGRVHPEPELAVVISRTAKRIKREDAFNHVFGYTIFNDITSPTMRGEDTFHYRAIHPVSDKSNEIAYVDSWVSYPGRYKGADTFSCLGPWLVTKDDIADPHRLNVSCSHDGRLITEDNTENLFHKTADVLTYLSSFTTLMPGDIVAMGTALKKSANGGAVQNVDLNKLGGSVSVTIEGLGTLTNPVLRHGA